MCLQQTVFLRCHVVSNLNFPEASIQIADETEDADAVVPSTLDVGLLPLQEEVKLCERMLHWNPWELPNESLIAAMRTHVFILMPEQF